MSIQAGINQSLSLASLLATQSPTLRAKAEERRETQKLKRQEDAVNKAIESTGSDIAAKEPYGEELANIKKQQFELKPSEESFKAYKDTMPTKISETEADPEEIAMEIYESERRENEIKDEVARLHNADKMAQEALKAKQAEKKGSRRKFIDFMKDEPTSLGATIGELDPKLQKQILKTYSSAERKKIMDRGDNL